MIVEVEVVKVKMGVFMTESIPLMIGGALGYGLAQKVRMIY